MSTHTVLVTWISGETGLIYRVSLRELEWLSADPHVRSIEIQPPSVAQP